MFRSLNNQRCLFLLSALTAALLWLAPARSVQAAVYTYNARQRTINAGVLFVGSAADNSAPDPAPYVFYVLNARPDVKPVGWNFVNPLAQSTVSTAMATRWKPSYAIGASLTPDMAAYWEVALRDVSADDLQQFDVLYLSASGQNFLPADNEKLRRFVDNGGQLIVEYGSAGSSLPLFESATWAAGSATSALLPPLAPATSVYDLHSLLTQPNFLQLTDFPFLGAPSAIGGYGTIVQASSLFGQVLLQGSLSGVNAAQIGGGQIITSSLNLGPTISISRGASFVSGPFFPQAPYYAGPTVTSYDVSVVPSVDLKLLSNVISWADTHPTENKTSHQNASGPSSASYAAAWAYPDPANGNPLPSTAPSGYGPSGAAVSGDYVFVTDSTGVLHAFDAIPDELLTGSSTPVPSDDGKIDFSSTTAPTPYDEVWNTGTTPISSLVSGPTAFSYAGQSLVMVEDRTGVVFVYYAVTGQPWTTAKLGVPNTAGFSTPVPAPTYYDGRVYAGQPDGTLFVYSMNGQGSAGGTGALLPVDPQTISGEYVTASPAVGLLASGTITNSIVAYVPTTQNMNTVLLGARNDPLINYSLNGQFLGYNVSRNARYSLPNLFVDTASIPAARAYDSGGNFLAFATGQGQDPVFPLTTQSTNVDDQFGDWDIDFTKSIPQNGGMTLTLHEIKAQSLSNTAPGQSNVSAPAIDRKGDYYYTVDDGNYSYLFGVHDDIAQRNVQIKFRFRLPVSTDASVYSGTDPNNPNSTIAWNYMDRDNVNYNNTTSNADGSSRSLLNFKFVGAPVVDGQGNVYVAAQNRNGGTAAVLCFNADQEVTAEPPVPTPNGFDATQARYFQPDESTGNPQNPLVAIPQTGRGAGRYGQISTAGTVASVFNFGRGSGGSRQIAGNLTEPQPFTATPNAQSGLSVSWMYFHTNLAWYATFAVHGTISGLSKAGNRLLLCDSGGSGNAFNTLYKLPASPTVAAGKLAALTIQRAPLGIGAHGSYLDVGIITAAPSAGGGAMVVNGTKGIAAFNQQLTLVADNNRILEADADGNAVWSADATTRTGANGLSTKIDFAHPSALAQFAPNDYLVADTGNNRCVRFDRGGNVLWELTRFNDPIALMGPGQPSALGQPSSVEIRVETFTYKDANGITQTGKKNHYLVADTGNDRIVEVTDTVDALGRLLFTDANGNVAVSNASGNFFPGDHILTWVTHTGDKSGRHYHYAGASYLDIPSSQSGVADTISIFALITNTRLAQLPIVGGPLAPASADAPGGSIVAFNRPTVPVAFNAITATTPNDLSYVATSFTSFTSGTGTNKIAFSVRNPRYLHVYAPPQAAPSNPKNYVYSFLYADSNGAFDLVYQGANTPPVSYGLAFTQANYRNMTLVSGIPADVQGNIPFRGGVAASGSSPAVPPIPFVPTCVQRLNNDGTNSPVASHIDRYLITQSYSQGELARLPGSTLPNRLGGEIFEVDVSTIMIGTTTTITQDPVGGFAGGVTLSHPMGASPLTQPTFAIRTAQ